MGLYNGSIVTLVGCILYSLSEGFIDFGILAISLGGTLFTGLLYKNHRKITTLLFGILILLFTLFLILSIQSLYQKDELEEKEILDYATKARNIVEKKDAEKNNKKIVKSR